MQERPVQSGRPREPAVHREEVHRKLGVRWKGVLMRAADFEQLSSMIIGILIDLRQLTNIEYKYKFKKS